MDASKFKPAKETLQVYRILKYLKTREGCGIMLKKEVPVFSRCMYWDMLDIFITLLTNIYSLFELSLLT